MLNRSILRVVRNSLLDSGQAVMDEQQKLTEDKSMSGPLNEILQVRDQKLQKAIDLILEAHNLLGEV